MTDNDRTRDAVREGYAEVARGSGCCCSCGCAPSAAETIASGIGYSKEEIGAVPDGANLWLGCGNPLALAALKEGDIVLDLGSGAGFDCFLAARRVGPGGRVIGVDMTPEMLAKARENARKGGFANVEFRQGFIEELPVDDATVDLIISNCVINLSPDKPRVFREAFRTLKAGGSLMVSDIVLREPLPPEVLGSVQAYVGCLAGAMLRDDYLGAMAAAGFGSIQVLDERPYPLDFITSDATGRAVVEKLRWSPERLESVARAVLSIKVEARKG
jgi:arsenite methyltransferase